jgi:hypothetical protein
MGEVKDVPGILSLVVGLLLRRFEGQCRYDCSVEVGQLRVSSGSVWIITLRLSQRSGEVHNIQRSYTLFEFEMFGSLSPEVIAEDIANDMFQQWREYERAL